MPFEKMICLARGVLTSHAGNTLLRLVSLPAKLVFTLYMGC
jgi:hypothetical protein